MPSQGAVLGPADRDFGLIETFRWSHDDGYAHLAKHMARLTHSADVMRFVFRRDAVEQRLTAFADDLTGSPARVRLVLSRDGSTDITATPLVGPSVVAYDVAIAGPRHPADDEWLRHKTTMRDRYEHPLAVAAASTKADEVLFLNEREELCEGARSNLFVKRDGRLLTPPLSCGLLPGTLRAHLLETGQAQEAVLRLADLRTSTEWFMGNSVRGLVRSRLVAAGDAQSCSPVSASWSSP